MTGKSASRLGLEDLGRKVVVETRFGTLRGRLGNFRAEVVLAYEGSEVYPVVGEVALDLVVERDTTSTSVSGGHLIEFPEEEKR